MFNLSGSWFLASSKSKASYIPPNPQIHDVKLNPHSNPHSFHNHIVIDHHHHHPQIWIPESNHQIIIRTCGIIKSSSIFTIIIFTIPKLSNEIPKLCQIKSPKLPKNPQLRIQTKKKPNFTTQTPSTRPVPQNRGDLSIQTPAVTTKELCVLMYIYIYEYVFIIDIYIYMYVYICVYIHMYVYIYIYRLS